MFSCCFSVSLCVCGVSFGFSVTFLSFAVFLGMSATVLVMHQFLGRNSRINRLLGGQVEKVFESDSLNPESMRTR